MDNRKIYLWLGAAVFAVAAFFVGALTLAGGPIEIAKVIKHYIKEKPELVRKKAEVSPEVAVKPPEKVTVYDSSFKDVLKLSSGEEKHFKLAGRIMIANSLHHCLDYQPDKLIHVSPVNEGSNTLFYFSPKGVSEVMVTVVSLPASQCRDNEEFPVKKFITFDSHRTETFIVEGEAVLVNALPCSFLSIMPKGVFRIHSAENGVTNRIVPKSGRKEIAIVTSRRRQDDSAEECEP